MKYAFLNGNKVFKVEDTYSNIAIECADNVTAGWLRTADGFSPPPDSLEFIKDRKNQEINTIRSVKLSEPVLYSGHYFDADKESSANLVAVVSAVSAGIPLPDGFTWRTANNDNVMLSVVDLISLAGTMLAVTNNIYFQSWAKKGEVLYASTIEEVLAISW